MHCYESIDFSQAHNISKWMNEYQNLSLESSKQAKWLSDINNVKNDYDNNLFLKLMTHNNDEVLVR